MRLQGKVAIVSGAARGIGAATARLFAHEGARIVLGDVLTEEGDKTAKEIQASGGEAVFLKLDVTKLQDWERAVSRTLSRYGRVDVLVNNAGVGGPKPFEEMTVEEWERVMSINSTGVFLGTKAVLEAMKKNGGGSIVNVSSISGIVGISRNSAYAASKGAVRVFTKYCAIQFAKYGIRVNSIHPGVVESPLTAKGLSDPENRQAAIARHPIGRLGRPEDIAYGALYLASDESSFVTGAELVIDGGFTAQ